MINGAHLVVYSTDAEADKAFFRDVLGFANVDAGAGRLIFKLPPGEMQVHPAEQNGRHELFRMCDDVDRTIAVLSERGVACEPVSDQGWGRLTRIALPGGGDLGLYEPRHARP